MKKILITTMLVIAAISTSAQTRQLFDFGWQFTHNGTTQTVDLPHDWDIFEGPNSGKAAIEREQSDARISSAEREQARLVSLCFCRPEGHRAIHLAAC